MRGALRAALAFVGALPWLSAFGTRVLPAWVTRAVALAFAATCHHAPERTLSILGAPMCVCSRCAGLYAGIAIAALGSWAFAGERSLRSALSGAFALLAVDIVTQDAGLHAPWHATRLATGALVGAIGVAWMLGSVESTRVKGTFHSAT